jgi:putative phosphoribosyl transferase
MFSDREQAGELLAERVAELSLPDPLVLALPRGGVPVAVPVARRLGAPLDLALVRKIGAPGSPELAAGAIMVGAGVEEIVYNDEVLAMAGLRREELSDAVAQRRAELDERRRRYLGGRDPEPVAGRSVIVVDDGIATGATMRAALQGLRRQQPGRLVLAVPVAPPDTLARLRSLVDDLVCLDAPTPFWAVGQHYRDFAQVSDDDVVSALEAARAGTRVGREAGEKEDEA